jgi:hypothetical protein
MKNGQGQLAEIYLDSGGRLICPPECVPAPGQYLLAHAAASDSPLAAPIFFAKSSPDGFLIAPPLPSEWTPGSRLYLRGPLGHGFTLPTSAQHVALVAFDDSPARLRGLIPLALKQGASVTLICESVPEDLPEEVEVQPLRSLEEISHWADYIAFDVARESLSELLEKFGGKNQLSVKFGAQVLVRAPMPCGALAECGVCALVVRRDWLMICKHGPVFELSELI